MRKIALITGATAGIGEATARLLAKNGWDLILCGRRNERLTALSAELETASWPLCFDVRNRQATEKTLESLPEAWKNIQLLVNNAGLSQGLDPVFSANPDDWDTMIDTNIKGLLYVSRWVSKLMIDRQISGHIIHLSSTAGKEAYALGSVYCGTKHAVEAITKALRMELNPYGIKVSTVSPGLTETEFSLVRFKGDSERARQVYAGFQPLTAQDIAEGIAFMADRPAHVNIADLVIMPTAQAGAGLVKKSV